MRSEGDTMPSLGRGLFILLPLVLYPVVDFIFRIANGLIAPDLRSEFDLNAAVLGFISSVFFVAFGLSHSLPAFERYAPRAVTSLFRPVGLVLCSSFGPTARPFCPRTDTHGCRYVRQLDRGDQDHLDLVARPTDLDDLAVDRCDGHRRHVRRCPLSIAARGRRLANAFHDSRRGNISSIVPSSTR